jgi:hypothetical protein
LPRSTSVFHFTSRKAFRVAIALIATQIPTFSRLKKTDGRDK